MVSGQPHFVRCIKPNNDRQANRFDREKVLVQLRYTGVSGKPPRSGARATPTASSLPISSQESCSAILEKAKLENWAMGKTKVFLKYYHVEHLNLVVQRTTDRIVLVQACVRGWLGARGYRKILAQRQQSALVHTVCLPRTTARKKVADDKSQVQLEAFIIKFQAVCRGYLAKKNYKAMVDVQNLAATKIQARYRGHRDWKSFQTKKEAKAKEQEEASLKEEEQESAVKEEGEQQKEEETAAETKESSDEGASASANGSLTAEEEEARAAVVLQSNFRGYQERKKFKERHKTQAGDELEVPTTSTGEEELEVAAEQNDEGKKEEEEEGKQDSAEGETDAPKQAEDEAEEKTVEGEDNDDSDHTQVPEEGEEQDEVSTVVGEDEMGEEQAAVDEDKSGEGQAEGAGGEEGQGGAVSVEDETKAATVIQSNFRGHRERKRLEEEGKLPARKKNEETPPEEKEASGTGDGPGEETPKDEASTAAKEEDASTAVDASAVDVLLEDPDEANAAVVIQSVFRGHKERKRLEEEGIIPKKNKSSDEVSAEGESAAAQKVEPPVESEPDLAAVFQGGEYEVKAATIIQRNYRGHRDRKKLKEKKEAMGQDGEEAVPSEGGGEGGTNMDEEAQEALDVTDVKVERKEEEVDAEKERLEEEQAAVKIQRNYRGYKERKNLRANKESAQLNAEDFEAFSKDVRKASQDFASIQEKLNEIILNHQSTNALFVKPSAVNGLIHKSYSSVQPKGLRTPRRTQPPKTLNTPEDSTYYTLIHVSPSRPPRPLNRSQIEIDLRKLLDVDDQYYPGLTTSHSSPCIPSSEAQAVSGSGGGGGVERRQSVERKQSMDRRKSMERRTALERRLSTEQRPDRKQPRERAVSEPEPPTEASEEKRCSLSRMSSMESGAEEDNPYDFRHLLRKTSQRRRLIKHH
ncbi:hypothetical protein CRUP_028436 [Coryphaenoides rupestris]|nr:hypothetical protein CRUP_028436 [Coryphaenoides rupestris]